MPKAHKTVLYRAYALAANLVAPLAYHKVAKKLAQAEVPQERIRERLGYASLQRPDGELIWFHAASVGESLSVLSLIETLGELRPELSFLITSGTPTSARLIEQRIPPRCRHQFAPLDAAAPLKRFLRHWRPNAAVIVESELWPQTLVRTYESDVPLALVNARLSEKSLQSWSRRPKTATALLGVFSVILTQNAQMADALKAIGANPDQVAPGANLKATSAPLPVNRDLVADMGKDLGGRPIWVAASTHPGEEEIVLVAHNELLKSNPDLCLILAPRHPERGAKVEDLIVAQGFSVGRRSTGALPGDAQVYLADTLGELGSWYAMTDWVFLGGSLLPIGGHNPFEVVQSEAVVLTGPHVANFAETFSEMEQAGAAEIVADAAAIAAAMKKLLADSDHKEAKLKAARGFVRGKSDELSDVAKHLIRSLELDKKNLRNTPPAPLPSLHQIEVIAPNFKRRHSGVTSTVIRLVPLQAQDIAITACAPDLPPEVPNLAPAKLLGLPRIGPNGPRVWHARRNVEMVAGLALKYVAGKKLKLLFTSAAQRRHTGFTRWLIRQMDAIIATSSKSANYLERDATVIRHGVDCEQFHPVKDRAGLRAELGLPTDGPLIGCFGRIRRQKGNDIFVAAMIEVFSQNPTGKALIMGRATTEHQDYLKELKEAVDTAGLSDRILFREEVPIADLARHFQALDLYVAPQRWEGFGLTPLEAMACGSPVVATRVGAFEELIVEGETGHLVEIGDTVAIANHVAQILSDPEKFDAMSKAARGHVAGNFRLEQEAASIIAIYRRLLQS